MGIPDHTYQLERLASLLGIDLLCQNTTGLHAYCDHTEYNPLCQSEDLRLQIMRKATQQDIPLLYEEAESVYIICIKTPAGYYYAGPFTLREMNRVERHQYCKRYNIPADHEQRLKTISFSDLLDLAQLLDNLLNGREPEDRALISVNHLGKEIGEESSKEAQEQILHELRTDEEGAYHHTYQEERRLLDCVREGRPDDALHYTRRMDEDLGKMSDTVLNQWRNTAVVGITLCTRAAIEGGVSPAVAYQLSDYYISKCDSTEDVTRIIRYRNAAVERLATEVHEARSRKHTSSYVEQCKDYIHKNYRTKIYLDDIADRLGVSAGYLSRLFTQETGTRFQDYVVQVRVERAANLLTYSEESLSKIAEYVNFPSQSYMGKVFKEYKGVSPKKYRELHKPREF